MNVDQLTRKDIEKQMELLPVMASSIVEDFYFYTQIMLEGKEKQMQLLHSPLSTMVEDLYFYTQIVLLAAEESSIFYFMARTEKLRKPVCEVVIRILVYDVGSWIDSVLSVCRP